MTTEASLERLCQVQTWISESEREATLQMLADRFGKPENFCHRFTSYKMEDYHTFSVRIEEEVPDPEGETPDPSLLQSDKQKQKHSIATIAEPKRIEKVEKAFSQHVVFSEVIGDAHLFISSMGYKPKRTWIERGYIFRHDTVSIKVVSILKYDGVNLDPNTVAVLFECVGIPESTGKHLADLHEHLFPGKKVQLPKFRN